MRTKTPASTLADEQLALESFPFLEFLFHLLGRISALDVNFLKFLVAGAKVVARRA
jgi:hypothetical protein